jgi:hypothetical protein
VLAPLVALARAIPHPLTAIHTTLRTSPAMAAGVTDRLFDVMDLVKLLIEAESAKAA